MHRAYLVARQAEKDESVPSSSPLSALRRLDIDPTMPASARLDHDDESSGNTHLLGPDRPRPLKSVALIAVLLLSSACVSKKEFEASQARLSTCEDEKSALTAEVSDWQQRFDRESQRWQDLGDSVSEAVPQALAEFHTERDRILEIVPQQVQSEVASYLDDYFATVSEGFRRLKADNEQIQRQLETTSKALEAVGADTRSIGTAIDEALADERSKREEEQDRRLEVASRLVEVVDKIVEFDRNRIDCKGCEDRLTLSRKERQAILAFHDELTRELAVVQTFAGNRTTAPSEEEVTSDG